MSTPAALAKRPRLRLLTGPDARRLVVGVVLVLALLFGQQIYGRATARQRLDRSLWDTTKPSNVIVVLSFQPERFHNERIAEYGAFAGRDGAINRLRLRFVSPANLRALASISWIARIEPLKN